MISDATTNKAGSTHSESPAVGLGSGPLCEAGPGSVDAVLKSMAISFRAAQALHATALGFVCMAVEEAGMAASALQSAEAPSHRIRLAMTLTQLAVLRATSRTLLFWMTCAEMAEEAATPLVRRTSATIDRLTFVASA